MNEATEKNKATEIGSTGNVFEKSINQAFHIAKKNGAASGQEEYNVISNCTISVFMEIKSMSVMDVVEDDI